MRGKQRSRQGKGSKLKRRTLRCAFERTISLKNHHGIFQSWVVTVLVLLIR